MNTTSKFLISNAKILDIKVPFTKGELKHAFRTSAFEHHPDRGGKHEAFTESEFTKIKNAYDFLLPFASEETETSLVQTAQGDLISVLGKGLGDLVNSVNCKKCNGQGWIDNLHTKHTGGSECWNCDGSGVLGNRYGAYLKWINPCPICFGSGVVGTVESKVRILHTCHRCNGTGQTEIFNPVIPKNRTSSIPFKKGKVKKSYCNCGALIQDSKCWRCTGSLTW